MVIRHGPAGGQYGHDLSAVSSGVTSHHSSKGLGTARKGGQEPGKETRLIILTVRCLVCRMQDANAGKHPQSLWEWKSFSNER